MYTLIHYRDLAQVNSELKEWQRQAKEHQQTLLQQDTEQEPWSVEGNSWAWGPVRKPQIVILRQAVDGLQGRHLQLASSLYFLRQEIDTHCCLSEICTSCPLFHNIPKNEFVTLLRFGENLKWYCWFSWKSKEKKGEKKYGTKGQIVIL